MPQTIYEYGGNGTPVHMALANGFPPETYAPLLAPLTDHYRVFSLPPRPLWTPPPSPESINSWEDLADDLLNGLRERNITDIIGIGHSMGAVVTMLAVLREPERFKGIVLLEPGIFPPNHLLAFRLSRWFGLIDRFPLAQKARKRRSNFANKDEAFAYWRGKRLFYDWSDEALWLYVNGLTHRNGNGTLELVWSREWEAKCYTTIYADSWRQLPKLDGQLPVLVMRGTESNTFFPSAAERLRKKLPSATYREIPGGHLVPQANPGVTREVLTEWLNTIAPAANL
jgi:pimeloyl-ACP methyl ester carboxylesterase